MTISRAGAQYPVIIADLKTVYIFNITAAKINNYLGFLKYTVVFLRFQLGRKKEQPGYKYQPFHDAFLCYRSYGKYRFLIG